MMGKFGVYKVEMPFVWCSTSQGCDPAVGFRKVIYLAPLDL
ncbi:hypothetical protein IAD21_03090 [Abditibacteriota bacterium]|nr:hypothetical protein IAD21_03090 [Abditibacteriota bacterium]